VTPGVVILFLKVAVAAVTVLFLASLIALAAGRVRLHGRINTVFFILTVTTVLAFEAIIRFALPNFTSSFTDEQREALTIHLFFSVPSALLLPFLLFTGWKHRRAIHIAIGVAFLLLWTGTFVTGIFFLPHTLPEAP
jgi:hypothetical protein